MTLADTIRHQVLTLDANGIPASHIAHALRIPVDRVDRILDDHDAEQGVPHPERVVAPVLEPLGGPAVIVSQAAVGGGRDNDPTRPKRQPRARAAKLAKAPQEPKERPPSLIECGTVQGYYRHRREGTARCEACRVAYNAYDREKRPRKTDVPYAPKGSAPCGTVQGRARHKRAGEPICDPCREAYNKWQQGRWAKTRGLVQDPVNPIDHGTQPGYQAHRRRGEKPCDACRLAWNEWKLMNKRRAS